MSSAFPVRLFRVVEDRSLDPVISWSKSNRSFIVRDLEAFHREVGPVEFGSNIIKFLFELKFHGFRRIKSDGKQWEFGHEYFVRGRPELLKKMMAAENGRAKKARARARSKAAKRLARVEDQLQLMCI